MVWDRYVYENYGLKSCDANMNNWHASAKMAVDFLFSNYLCAHRFSLLCGLFVLEQMVKLLFAECDLIAIAFSITSSNVKGFFCQFQDPNITADVALNQRAIRKTSFHRQACCFLRRHHSECDTWKVFMFYCLSVVWF